MPFKSQAQRAKLRALAAQGKIAQSTVDEWERATGDAKLPERVGEPSKPGVTLKRVRSGKR